MTAHRWADLKLTRSWWLFGDLFHRVDLWNASGEFAADVRVLEDRSALEFLTPAGFRPPVAEWGLLLGDAVHNARSALDAVVWDLAHSSGAEPAAAQRVAFPVTLNEREWRNNVKNLETVPADSLERIRQAQPWVAAPTTPDRDWLSILSRLDNDDKHRGRVVAVPMEEKVGLEFTGLSLGDPIAGGGYFHVWGSGLDGTEAVGTPFARFSFGAAIQGDGPVSGAATIHLAPAAIVNGHLIPVAALQQEMWPYVRRVIDEVSAGGELHEATILPERFEPRTHDG